MKPSKYDNHAFLDQKRIFEKERGRCGFHCFVSSFMSSRRKVYSLLEVESEVESQVIESQFRLG